MFKTFYILGTSNILNELSGSFSGDNDKVATGMIKSIHLRHSFNSLGEWLGCSLTVVGVDGSSLVTAPQRCDGFNFTMPNC